MFLFVLNLSVPKNNSWVKLMNEFMKKFFLQEESKNYPTFGSHHNDK